MGCSHPQPPKALGAFPDQPESSCGNLKRWLQILWHSSCQEVGSVCLECLCLLWFIKNSRRDASDLRGWIRKGHTASMLFARIFIMEPWASMLESNYPETAILEKTLTDIQVNSPSWWILQSIPARCQTCEWRSRLGSGSPAPANPASAIYKSVFTVYNLGSLWVSDLPFSQNFGFFF